MGWLGQFLGAFSRPASSADQDEQATFAVAID
jgi:hypothetical protein